MTEFIRSIHKRIKDLFILDTEAQCNLADHLKHQCNLADHLKHYIPDSLGESEFRATLGSILEECTHGLVVREPSGGRGRLYLRPFFGWSKRLAIWLAMYSLLYICTSSCPS